MKVAALQYQYDFFSNWDDYQKKISFLVGDFASQKVDLLLFPEYAGFEMSSFAPLERLQEWIPAYLGLFQELSNRHQMLICSGTQIVQTDTGTFNRSFFFAPNRRVSYQDKCILTPYEVQEGILSSGNILRLFNTKFGKIGICICYDVEFPALVDRLVSQGAKLILVPSYTSTVHGFYRVFSSCRARALENQCFVVQSALVGQTDVEIAYGSATVCSPIDEGFPEDGILELGPRDQSNVIIKQLDFQQLEKVRSQGQTRNYLDGKSLRKREILLESIHWT